MMGFPLKSSQEEKRMRRWVRLWVLICFGLIHWTAGPVQALAKDLPDEAFVQGVTGHAQSYTLSCESRSAVDWAAYWGVKISETKFLNSLPRSDNPEVGFVGSPNDAWGGVPPDSYGVHAKPVAAALQRFGLRAEAQKGMGWDALRGEIAAGRPVIVWVVGAMWPGQAQKYTASNGKTVTVAAFEHTMIVVGYNRSLVYVIDAYSGLRQAYPVQAFLASWTMLGRMAVTGGGKAEPASLPEAPSSEAPPPEPEVVLGQHTYLPLIFAQSGPVEAANQPGVSAKSPAAPDTYTVKRGDFLMAVARRFGLDWRTLADLNGLSFPYTLYSGQVLRLK
jgi:uncharacterized protein YvpB